MPGMRGGVLSPEDAKRLMAVLQEMTEYVDGEDLDAIAAQKPIYEMGNDMGGGGAMMAPPTEEAQAGVDEAIEGINEDMMGKKGPPFLLEKEETKVVGRPSRLDRRR